MKTNNQLGVITIMTQANGEKYGKLYNWYAVNDPRGLAPDGWHVPSDAEWTILTDYLGGGDVAGTKMKSTDFWADYEGNSGNGTNESGFSGLPGGYRYDNGRSATLASTVTGGVLRSTVQTCLGPLPVLLLWHVYRDNYNKERWVLCPLPQGLEFI